MAELLGLDGNRYKSTIPKEKIFTLVMEDDTMRENNIFRDFKIYCNSCSLWTEFCGIYEKDKNEFMKCKNCKVELKKNIIKNNYIAFISKKIKTYYQMKLICEKGHCSF